MLCYIFRLSLQKSQQNKQTTERATTEELYPGRDTFVFDQGHVTKNQPITVFVLLSESLQSWTILVKKSERGLPKTIISYSSPRISTSSFSLPPSPYTMLIWEMLIAVKLFVTHQTTLTWGEGGGENMVVRLFTCQNAWKGTFS